MGSGAWNFPLYIGPGTLKKSELSHLWTWNMFLLPGLERKLFLISPRAYIGRKLGILPGLGSCIKSHRL